MPRRNKNNGLVFLSSFVLVLGIGAAIFYFGTKVGENKSTPAPVVVPTTPNSTPMTQPAKPTTSTPAPLRPVPVVPASLPVTSPLTPISLLRPELDAMKAFLPVGGRFVRYWYSNLNGDSYDEVVIGYVLTAQVHVMTLGIKDTTKGYEVLWDKTVPGDTIVNLITDKIAKDYLIIAQTTGGGASYLDIYKYADDSATVLALQGGDFDGKTSEISFVKKAATLSTVSLYNASYSKAVVSLDFGPATTAGGIASVKQDNYQYQSGTLVYQTQTQVDSSTL